MLSRKSHQYPLSENRNSFIITYKQLREMNFLVLIPAMEDSSIDPARTPGFKPSAYRLP